jgi:hypothetical protein
VGTITSPAAWARQHHKRIIESCALLGLLLCLLLLVDYPKLPDRVPSHYDHTGLPDGWGQKSVLFVLPVVALVQYGLLTILAHGLGSGVDRGQATPNPSLLLSLLKLEIVWMCTYIEWRTILVARETAAGLGAGFLPMILIILLGTVGWQMRSQQRPGKGA